MKIKLAYFFAAVAMASAATIPANASDWSLDTARVTRVEASYMPGRVTFQIDRAAGNCAAGQYLTWNAQGSDEALMIANSQAVYSLLLTAVGSGKLVTLYGNNDCTVTFVHITNQN